MKAASFGFKLGWQKKLEKCGRLPKDLKIAFEIACARLEVTQTAALEEAIRDWLKKQESTSGEK
ncbi:hypothetical protein [Scytonema sp. PRP1]|uniref:hypothetical protein n=1 Tax=Scytonema sp. PRP1 TaxID=3120513 RepID=UPI002FD6A395